MSDEAFKQRTCETIILSNKLGDAMQNHFTLLYYSTIIKNAKSYSLWCDIGRFRDLLNEISQQNISINGFRIYLGLNKDGLQFIFKGLINLINTGNFYLFNSDGKNYRTITSQDATDWMTSYASNILLLPEVDKGLVEGNTKSHAFIGLMSKFNVELSQHDNNSPIKGIKIKLSSYVNNNSNPNPTQSDYTNRLLVGFSFVKADGSETYLTSISGRYGCHIPSHHPLHDGLGADTGSPCPPKTNCP